MTLFGGFASTVFWPLSQLLLEAWGWRITFAIATFVFGVIAVHLVSLLTSAGLTAAQAVTVSMLVGPMQVAGRVIELGVSGRVRSATVGIVAFALMLLALVALVSVEGFGIAAIVFVTAYGCGNGVLTIVKGTAPAELFGREGLGALLGHPVARRALRQGGGPCVLLRPPGFRPDPQHRAGDADGGFGRRDGELRTGHAPAWRCPRKVARKR